ncbi:MAG: AMP-binding protein, partial [Acidobacteriota bacterium]
MNETASDPTDFRSGRTLVDILRRHAERQGDSEACRFLAPDGTTSEEVTYGELDARARAVAGRLQAVGVVDERTLLLFPPGLDFVTGFLACLYAGTLAVPAYPPASKRHLPRLRSILLDAKPAVILTSASLLHKTRAALAAWPESEQIRWLALDDEGLGTQDLAHADILWQEPDLTLDHLAFLQYTSGSTADPKG